jgi:hypothetical protein
MRASSSKNVHPCHLSICSRYSTYLKHLSLITLATPPFLDDHLNARSKKDILRNKKGPTIKHPNNYSSTLTLKGHVRQITMIPHPGFRYIITLDLGIPPKIQQDMITIGSFPNYSCPYFKELVTKALGKRGQWTNCKHLYFIF